MEPLGCVVADCDVGVIEGAGVCGTMGCLRGVRADEFGGAGWFACGGLVGVGWSFVSSV